MEERKHLILLVDDNDDHCMLIEDMFVATGFARQVVRHRDAEGALAELLDLQADPDSDPPPLPDLIFLDIRLPGMSGIEMLQRLKTHPRTRTIPIFMLTTSERQEEIQAGYAAGVCGYIVKPVDFALLEQKILALKTYWDIASELPTRGRECARV